MTQDSTHGFRNATALTSSIMLLFGSSLPLSCCGVARYHTNEHISVGVLSFFFTGVAGYSAQVRINISAFIQMNSTTTINEGSFRQVSEQLRHEHSVRGKRNNLVHVHSVKKDNQRSCIGMTIAITILITGTMFAHGVRGPLLVGRIRPPSRHIFSL